MSGRAPSPAAVVEESLANGVEETAGTSGLAASLGVSGDDPCGDQEGEDSTGKEGEEAATAVCYTVPATTSSVTQDAGETEVKWGPDEPDKYHQTGLGISTEVSLQCCREQTSLLVSGNIAELSTAWPC